MNLPDPIINDEPEFTITTLVKAPDYQTQSSSIYRQINGGETTLRIETGSIVFQCKASYGNCFTASGWVYLSAPIPDNDWHSYTAVYNRNAGYMELYIDGNLEVTTGVNNGSLANCNLYSAQIGESGHSMYVDELAIFDYAQSASEIQSYNCNSLDGSENGLLAYWNLNEGSGSFVSDITNNFNGVLFGSYSSDNACNSSATLDSTQWSTGDTTASITVSPSQTTTYWVTQTTNGVSCSDSITITVLDTSLTVMNIESCDSYLWLADNQVYNQNGQYTEVLTNSNGCDSTVILNLTINHTDTSYTNITACDGYTWNGVNYTNSGIYTNTYINTLGCDSTHTLNLTINSSDTVFNSVTPCPPQPPSPAYQP